MTGLSENLRPSGRGEVSSLLYWFPKIRDLGIPVPKTVWLEVEDRIFNEVLFDHKLLPDELVSDLKAKAKEIGYPLFVKTAHFSAKHHWKKTCYIESEDKLIRNIIRIAEEGHIVDIMGLPIGAIVFREYIPMDSRFTAFWAEMPVSAERRYFIDNGKLICRHFYWSEDAIHRPSVENWRELLKELNSETEKEIKLLTSYTRKIAKILNGFWSADFCKAKDGRWILIDMGVGEDSFHPYNCQALKKYHPHIAEEMRKQYAPRESYVGVVDKQMHEQVADKIITELTEK